jgi:hypothetical protein
MTVIIGIDPHKASHAACAIDEHERDLAQLHVRAGRRQLEQLVDWAQPFPTRRWAIESAGGLGYLLAQQLLAAGECVVDVPATLSSRVRVLASGRSNKNDPNDARAIAIAALRAPGLAVVRREDHVTVLRLLAKAHLDLGRARSRSCCRLHALAAELVAGGIRKEVVVSQAESFLAGVEPVSAAQYQRLELASEVLDDVRTFDTRLKSSKQRISTRSSRRARPSPTCTASARSSPRSSSATAATSAGSRPPATTPPTTAPHPSSSVPRAAPYTDSHDAGTAR